MSGVRKQARHRYAWTLTTAVKDQPKPIYHRAEYQQLLAEFEASKSICLVGSAELGDIELPLLVKEIGHGRQEAYTVYGYGGVWGNGTLKAEDVSSLKTFLAREGIVDLFIRHSPFINNQSAWPEALIELNRWTYTIDLPSDADLKHCLAELPQKVRWSVNYARRAGLDVNFYSLDTCPTNKITRFYRLYASRMAEKQVRAYYMFSEQFFLAHAHFLRSACELAEIMDPSTGELLAGAFFLRDDVGWAHYHLSAAVGRAMKLQAMEWLIVSAMLRYGEQGFRSMHLGGGHALDESDGLSRFKSKFAHHRHPFCTTKVICDDIAYQEERSRLPMSSPQFFLVTDARGY